MIDHHLRVSEQDWDKLQCHASHSFRTPRSPETAAIALLGHVDVPGQRTWLVHHVMLPGSGDIKIAEFGEVVLAAAYIRRAHLEMQKRNLIGLCILHTHPMADLNVAFSAYDNHEEPKLVQNLQEINPITNVISLVLGRNSQSGRVWQRDGTLCELRDIFVIGERIVRLGASGTPPAPPPRASAVFDRALKVTGEGALRLLSDLRFVVVGGSGTGSLVCEFLLRAGARHIVNIDDDVIKDVNVNRILHSRIGDVQVSEAKVYVVKRGIEDSRLPCVVDAVIGTILDKETMALLRSADVIFGCVDAATPRLLMSKFAIQYLVPFIDVGTEIGGDNSGVASVDARATYVAPGRRCLKCNGLVTARQLHFEGLNFDERNRVQKQNYSDDLAFSQPAVMDLNAQAAGLGTLILRHLLQPFMATPLPTSVIMGLVTFTIKTPNAPLANDDCCPICRDNPAAGLGDVGPTLGFDRDVVDAVSGRKTEMKRTGNDE